MYFIFGSKEKKKEGPSVNEICKTIGSYRQLYDSEPDYTINDCISIRIEAQTLGIASKLPLMGYVIDIKSDNNSGYLSSGHDLIIAYVNYEGCVKIGTFDGRLYSKLTEGKKIPDLLNKFIQDKPIDLEISNGSLVRPRLGLEFTLEDHSKFTSFLSSIEKMLTPCTVLRKKDNKIIIAGCLEKDLKIIEKKVECYELADYIP